MFIQYLTQNYKKNLIKEIDLPDVSIDVEIKEYVDEINTFSFICTTQCCQGHPDNGYLSVMVTETYSNHLENIVIPTLIQYCTDIFKKFEKIQQETVNVRYIFWFDEKNRDLFFKALLQELKKKCPVN